MSVPDQVAVKQEYWTGQDTLCTSEPGGLWVFAPSPGTVLLTTATVQGYMFGGKPGLIGSAGSEIRIAEPTVGAHRPSPARDAVLAQHGDTVRGFELRFVPEPSLLWLACSAGAALALSRLTCRRAFR